MSEPVHFHHHNELTELISRAAEALDTIEIAILVTIGIDGRPAASGNCSPEDLHEILRMIAGGEDLIEETKVMKRSGDQ